MRHGHPAQTWLHTAGSPQAPPDGRAGCSSAALTPDPTAAVDSARAKTLHPGVHTVRTMWLDAAWLADGSQGNDPQVMQPRTQGSTMDTHAAAATLLLSDFRPTSEIAVQPSPWQQAGGCRCTARTAMRDSSTISLGMSGSLCLRHLNHVRQPMQACKPPCESPVTFQIMCIPRRQGPY